MMSLDVLVAVNNKIAREAARKRLKPYVPGSPDEVPFQLPNLGYHEPNGWEKVESWFVDKYGVGLESEPAITHRRLKEILRDYIAENPSHGFAIVEEGEFQMMVAVFRPLEKADE